ncbi:MAG: EAL domain-containing protein [Deinococcales bacterium]
MTYAYPLDDVSGVSDGLSERSPFRPSREQPALWPSVFSDERARRDSEAVEAPAANRYTLLRELGQALHDDSLGLHLQAIANPADGRIAGYEALLRWPNEHRGLLLPNQFLPYAESSGLIVAIDRWVLRHAADHLRFWRRNGYDGWLAVNVSARSLEDPTYLDDIRTLAKAAPEIRGHVRLERTESSVIQKPESARACLAAVKALGIGVAIDDFGKGFTALGQLTQLDFDQIKIDAGLLRGVGVNPQAEAIVRSVLYLGRNIGVDVVAEGIESEAQRAWLAAEGGTLAQGFLLAEPTPMESVDPRATLV